MNRYLHAPHGTKNRRSGARKIQIERERGGAASTGYEQMLPVLIIRGCDIDEWVFEVKLS